MSKAFESAAQDYDSQYAKTGQRYQEAAPSSDAEDVSVAVGVPVDIEEREDGYSLWMDVPGLQKSDLKIQVFPGQRRITISGERKRQTGEAADGPEAGRTLRTRYERGVGKFSRTLKLSKDLDVATLTARVEKGVLHITAKKIPAVDPSSDVVEVAID
jgi:HSP20 family molecular chaperone IbpA